MATAGTTAAALLVALPFRAMCCVRPNCLPSPPSSRSPPQSARRRRLSGVRAAAGGGPPGKREKEKEKQSWSPVQQDLEKGGRRSVLEEELKDPRNFVDYLFPRPVRRVLWAGGAVSCLVGVLIDVGKLASNPALELASGGPRTLAINASGFALFVSLLLWENRQQAARAARRARTREAQIASGDREVYVDKRSGETLSRLTPVDDVWILRRLDKWAATDLLPMVGPNKGAILQRLVEERRPCVVVEVGAFLGYSAIVMGRALAPDARLISFEKDIKWALAAKRFVWQSKLADRVDVRWGDGLAGLQQMQKRAGAERIDLLFLDADPKQYLQYLQAAEPLLAKNALVVADNVVIFAKTLDGYLQYVRASGRYESKLIDCTLEYQDTVPDGIEVSTYIHQD
eukprot:jgi/Chlat1/9008/Chrsp94S08288